ncbi:hypothetical protein GCM10009665_64720 [Kitasatospora nipponensis]|uniref:Secreted protein n=1 Tax=Kitasatospora nipponensis TaxID=258049 RepID=A0ABN1WUW2_9ACTN
MTLNLLLLTVPPLLALLLSITDPDRHRAPTDRPAASPSAPGRTRTRTRRRRRAAAGLLRALRAVPSRSRRGRPAGRHAARPLAGRTAQAAHADPSGAERPVRVTAG